MAMRLAYIFIPVFMAFIGLSAVAVLEYQKHKLGAQAFDTQELGPLEYIRNRFAAFQKDRAAQSAMREMNIANALPPAPEGWTRTAYEVTHGEAITGAIFEPSMVVKDTEKSIQDAFRLVQRKPRSGAVASYINGAQVVSLKITKLEAPDPTRLEGALAIRMNAVVDGTTPSNPAWATVSGTQYEQLPQRSLHYISREERPVEYRRFEGNFGALFEIFAFTNADDAAVKAVLEGVNYTLLEDYVRATLTAQGVVVSDAPAEAAPSADEEGEAALPDDDTVAQEDAQTLLQKLGDLLASNRSQVEEEEEERQRMIRCGEGRKCRQKVGSFAHAPAKTSNESAGIAKGSIRHENAC